MRVLRELVHVDDVRHRSQRMQLIQRALPLQAIIQSNQKPRSAAEQNKQVHSRFERLQQADIGLHLLQMQQLDRADECQQPAQDDGAYGYPERPVVRRDFAGALGGLMRSGDELATDAAEPRLRKALLDALTQPLHRLDDAIGIERLVLHCKFRARCTDRSSNAWPKALPRTWLT